MLSVNIADLKNNLSRYLHQVKGGEEILIRDRNIPVARIVPLSLGEDFTAEEISLAAAGRLRLPTKPLPDSFWSARRRGPKIPLRRLVDAVTADREERDAGVLGR